MGKTNSFKFFISKAKPYLKKHYGSARAGVSATFQQKGGKGGTWQYDLHATVPADAVQKGAKHLKKHKTAYEIAGSGVAGYAGASLAQKKQKQRRK